MCFQDDTSGSILVSASAPKQITYGVDQKRGYMIMIMKVNLYRVQTRK